MNTELTQLMMNLRHVLHLMKQEELPPPPFKASTLCDLCASACGFCEWSDTGTCARFLGGKQSEMTYRLAVLMGQQWSSKATSCWIARSFARMRTAPDTRLIGSMP